MIPSFYVIFFAALVRRLLQGFKIRLPYTVVLLVLGILFGLVSGQYDEIHIYAKVVDSDPHLILHIFLPVLIFESAFAMEFHTFVKTFVQVIVLAIPGLGKFIIKKYFHIFHMYHIQLEL